MASIRVIISREYDNQIADALAGRVWHPSVSFGRIFDAQHIELMEREIQAARQAWNMKSGAAARYYDAREALNDYRAGRGLDE